MSDILYQSHPDCHEGQLTHLRALSVCEANLSQVAKKLHVGEVLIMDKGEELTGGREKPSVLCDAMEAILAAVYLDGGLDAARAIILRCWPKPEDVQRPMQDSKGALQEFLQRDGSEAPTYEIIAQDGPPHNREPLRGGTRPRHGPHEETGGAGGGARGAAKAQIRRQAEIIRTGCKPTCRKRYASLCGLRFFRFFTESWGEQTRA